MNITPPLCPPFPWSDSPTPAYSKAASTTTKPPLPATDSSSKKRRKPSIRSISRKAKLRYERVEFHPQKAMQASTLPTICAAKAFSCAVFKPTHPIFTATACAKADKCAAVLPTSRRRNPEGPSSVLYGRTNGGGVINMVSKYANFKQSRNIGAVYGSWANRSLNMDINEVLNKNVAIRLTNEVRRANPFRSGIDSKMSWFRPALPSNSTTA